MIKAHYEVAAAISAAGEETAFPIWEEIPGKAARNCGGESSLSETPGITNHELQEEGPSGQPALLSGEIQAGVKPVVQAQAQAKSH